MTWDGRPENPERDGWHWVKCNIAPAYPPECLYWHAEGGIFFEGDAGLTTSDWWPQHYDYLGPCLTPAEIAAREQAAREKALREAAAIVCPPGDPTNPFQPRKLAEQMLAERILALLDKEPAP